MTYLLAIVTRLRVMTLFFVHLRELIFAAKIVSIGTNRLLKCQNNVGHFAALHTEQTVLTELSVCE